MVSLIRQNTKKPMRKIIVFGVRRTIMFFKQRRYISKKLVFDAVMGRKRVVKPIFLRQLLPQEVYHNIIQQFMTLSHEDEHDVVFQQDYAQQPHKVCGIRKPAEKAAQG